MTDRSVEETEHTGCDKSDLDGLNASSSSILVRNSVVLIPVNAGASVASGMPTWLDADRKI